MLHKYYRLWLASFQGLGKEIWLLSLVNFVNRIGSMVVIFLTIYLTKERGLEIDDAGYILMFNGIGAVCGTYVGGWLSDRFGYYKLQIIALHLQGLVLLLLPHIHGISALAGTIFCMSLISETIRPANQVAFIAHSTPEMRTRAISLNRMGVNLSFTLAPAIGGFLILWSWQAIFWIDAITCFMAAWLMVIYLKEKPAAKPDLEELKPQDLSAFRDLHFLKFIGLSLINAIVFMQCLWTIPYFFKEAYGWSESFVGLVLAFNGLLVAVVEMPLVLRIEQKYPALRLVRAGLFCYALAHLALAIGLPPMVAAFIYIIGLSFGEIYVMPFSFTYASAQASTERRGQYMGLYSQAYAVSNIVAPIIGTQVIHRWGFNTLWCILACMAACSYLGTHLLERQSHANSAA